MLSQSLPSQLLSLLLQLTPKKRQQNIKIKFFFSFFPPCSLILFVSAPHSPQTASSETTKMLSTLLPSFVKKLMAKRCAGKYATHLSDAKIKNKKMLFVIGFYFLASYFGCWQAKSNIFTFWCVPSAFFFLFFSFFFFFLLILKFFRRILFASRKAFFHEFFIHLARPLSHFHRV